MKLTVHATIIARKGGMALALHILNRLGGLKSSGYDCGSLLRRTVTKLRNYQIN
jgi:hypothetical protein